MVGLSHLRVGWLVAPESPLCIFSSVFLGAKSSSVASVEIPSRASRNKIDTLLTIIVMGFDILEHYQMYNMANRSDMFATFPDSQLRPTCGYFPTIEKQFRPVIVKSWAGRAGACRRVRVAERFYREMLETGITPDVQAMNSLINAFSKAGSPDEALKVRKKHMLLSVLFNQQRCFFAPRRRFRVQTAWPAAEHGGIHFCRAARGQQQQRQRPL